MNKIKAILLIILLLPVVIVVTPIALLAFFIRWVFTGKSGRCLEL